VSGRRDRMPMPPPDELEPAQRAVVEKLSAGPRGRLMECFVPLIQTPELLDRVQAVGEYLRYQSQLADDLVELAILCVARHWDQSFEWYVHRPLAEQAGITPSVLEAVGAGRRPDQATDRELAVVDVVMELQHTRDLSDPAYDAALGHLDQAELGELFVLVGYYSLLATVMNGAHTATPAGGARLPDRAEESGHA
jgi:4-carboxymuconolactone decarboxylase